MSDNANVGAAVADIMTIQTPSLGDRSYLVTDGATAFVVDPQRDIDRALALTDSRGIAVTHVFETHIHNDYVTGGLALARAGNSRCLTCGAIPRRAAGRNGPGRRGHG
jgi:hydroxyacylglutathione hydrolase